MPTRAHTRRDPQRGKKEFSTNKGFTLIELMIGVGVLAIIMSLALPSYRSIIEKRQVTRGAEQLGAFLSAVQMEAVKRSENISVSYSQTDSANWCIGIRSGTEDCDCTGTDATKACKLTGEDQVRVINGDSFSYPGIMDDMSDLSNDGYFVFDPARGLVYADDDLLNYDSAELKLLSDNGRYALNVQISPTGRIKLCSESSEKQVPGYDVCTP
ncbi:GspH/FimT family pseudopilin [Pseudomonadota bacterium]